MMKANYLSRFAWVLAATIGLMVSVDPPLAHAQAITAKISSDGVRFQVRQLGSTDPVDIGSTGEYAFVDGNIGSSQLRTHGFAQWSTGDAYPVEFDIGIENSFSRAEVLDGLGRSTVEIHLERPGIDPNVAWYTRSTADMRFSLWLGPQSELTASSFISAQFDDPYSTNLPYDRGVTGLWEFSIGSTTIPVTSRYANFGEWSQLSITNDTLAPMQVWFTSKGELNAQLTPLVSVAPVPEPATSVMLYAGLLGLCSLELRRRRTLNRRAAQVAPCLRKERLPHIAGRCAVSVACILPFPMAGYAQSLDVVARVGAVVGPAGTFGTPASHTWADIDMIGQVHQSGYPYTGRELAASGTIPYPFDISATSGDSWMRFEIDDPTSLPSFAAHRDASSGATGPGPAPYSFWGEIRITYANIVVPAYSIARIAMEIDVLPLAMADSSYILNANIGTPWGYSFWTTSALAPSHHILDSPFYEFDNSSSAVDLNSGQVYFVSQIYATVPANVVAEPSAIAMLLSGFMVLGGAVLARRIRL